MYSDKEIQEFGYIHPKTFEDGDQAAIMPLMFTAAIVYGIHYCGYEDRWCYKSIEAAKEALDKWDGVGEPEGWHRHPDSGRRYENGELIIRF